MADRFQATALSNSVLLFLRPFTCLPTGYTFSTSSTASRKSVAGSPSTYCPLRRKATG